MTTFEEKRKFLFNLNSTLLRLLLRHIHFSRLLFIFVVTGNLFLPRLGTAQKSEQIDSLYSLLGSSSEGASSQQVDLRNALAEKYYHLDFDSAYWWAHQALAMAKLRKYDKGLAEGYKNLGYAHIPWANYDSAKAYFDSSLVAAKQHNFALITSETYKGIGIANEESGRYQAAIEAYNKSLAIKSQINDQAGVGKVHNNMGQAFRNMGEFDSATAHLMLALENEAFLQEYNQGGSSYLILGLVKISLEEYGAAKGLFRKALSIFELPDQIIKVATCNAGLGKVYVEEGRLDSAKHFLKLGLQQFLEIRHLAGEAGLTALLAEAFRAEDNCDSALVYYRRGIAIRKSVNNMQFVSRDLTLMSRCLVEKGDYQLAIQNTQEAVEVAQKFGSKAEAWGAYSLLHDIYSRIGQFRKAYEMMKISGAYRDSMLNQQRIREISRLETEHKVSTLEKEKEFLEVEKKAEQIRLNSEISRGRWLQYVSVGGMLTLIAIAMTFYYSLKRKKLDNSLIAQQNVQISRAAQQLKSSRDKLEELTGFREGMTQMIAHDMKNSLNTIIGYSSGGREPELKNINQAGRQILRLVTNMLDVQKFEDAAITLNKRPKEISKLVAAAIEQVSLLIKEKDLSLDTQVDNEVMLEVDVEMFVRVLVNLLTNAIKYSEPGQNIRLTVSEEGDQCLIRVEDNGAGIGPDELPHIFDKFWQGASRRSGEAASTGLGLTYCRLATEAHDGCISATSEVGHGTAITISIPVMKQMDAQAASSAATLSKSELKVLMDKLKSFEVYQVGALREIVNDLNAEQVGPEWKRSLERAIASGDQQQYDQIVEQLV